MDCSGVLALYWGIVVFWIMLWSQSNSFVLLSVELINARGAVFSRSLVDA